MHSAHYRHTHTHMYTTHTHTRTHTHTHTRTHTCTTRVCTVQNTCSQVKCILANHLTTPLFPTSIWPRKGNSGTNHFTAISSFNAFPQSNPLSGGMEVDWVILICGSARHHKGNTSFYEPGSGTFESQRTETRYEPFLPLATFLPKLFVHSP